MKIKVFTAFSGYDSQCLALDRLKAAHPSFDYELVGWSEIDKTAIKAHNLLYPDAADRNYGDISRIDWSEVPDFDLFTYSFPCFVAGTLILTDKGYMPIEEMNESMKVLTHTNSYKRVIRTMQRKYDGTAYAVSAPFCHEFICTENHPLYVRRMFHKGHKAVRTFGEAEWKSPREITEDLATDRPCRTRRYYIGYAVNQESAIPKWEGIELNNWGHDRKVNTLAEKMADGAFWYLMGRYVGDGWKRQPGAGLGIVICCGGRNEDKLKEAIAHLEWNYTMAKDRTANKYHICSKELHSFVERYGYYAHGKIIDNETMGLPTELLKSFLEGLMDSDGYIDARGLHKITTVSKALAYGIGQCVSKAYNRPFSIYKTKRPLTVTIEGRECNQRDSYTVTWKLTRDKQDKSFYEDGYVWFPLNKLEPFAASTMVYNIEVEKDNSYTANGGIVHNCTDISNAGLQKGFSEESGTRSSLLWECRKAIAAKRPQFLLMENVKALVQKKFMPEFRRWLDELEGYGYANFWKVLNAKDYGVPQNRERAFCVSILRADGETPRYEFPKPFPLVKRLRDVLEDEVDESFYLKQEQVDRIIAHCDRKVAEGCGFKTNFQGEGGSAEQSRQGRGAASMTPTSRPTE